MKNMLAIVFACTSILVSVVGFSQTNRLIKVKSYITDTSINSKKVELIVTVINYSKKSIKIPNRIFWGFAKQDLFSDFIVELQKLGKNSKFINYPITDSYLPAYSEIEIIDLKPNDSVSKSKNIANTFPVGLEKGSYRTRIMFRVSKHNKIPDIYSNWNHFTIDE